MTSIPMFRCPPPAVAAGAPDERPSTVGTAPVVIAGYSVRALAASAARAGIPCIAVDACLDEDTRAVAVSTLRLDACGTGPAEDVRAVLSAHGAPRGVVYTGGGEHVPAALPDPFPILGNPPRVRDAFHQPERLAALLDQAGLPRPEQARDPRGRPGRGGGWLYKPCRGGGGVGITRDGAGGGPAGTMAQREHPGRTLGVLFAADGHRAYPVGAHWQWHAPRSPLRPASPASAPYGRFRYGGAIAVPRLPPPIDADLRRGLDRLVAATGLRGLNSVDLRVLGPAYAVLEVNPRPGLTVDIHDARCSTPLFQLHCDTVRGQPPDAWLPLDPSYPGPGAPLHGHAVVYAPEGLRTAPQTPWPEWVADRPGPGTPVVPGLPLCTVQARAPTPAAIAARLRARIRQLSDGFQRSAHSRREST